MQCFQDATVSKHFFLKKRRCRGSAVVGSGSRQMKTGKRTACIVGKMSSWEGITCSALSMWMKVRTVLWCRPCAGWTTSDKRGEPIGESVLAEGSWGGLLRNWSHVSGITTRQNRQIGIRSLATPQHPVNVKKKSAERFEETYSSNALEKMKLSKLRVSHIKLNHRDRD